MGQFLLFQIDIMKHYIEYLGWKIVKQDAPGLCVNLLYNLYNALTPFSYFILFYYYYIFLFLCKILLYILHIVVYV